MKLLELFSGTESVRKVAGDKGYSVVSLDLNDADINFNIMEWNYTEYELPILISSGLLHPARNTASRNNWHKKD